MGGEGHLNPAIHIEPLWVMIHLLRHESHAAHETKRLVEILELKLLVNGITAFDISPP